MRSREGPSACATVTRGVGHQARRRRGYVQVVSSIRQRHGGVRTAHIHAGGRPSMRIATEAA